MGTIGEDLAALIDLCNKCGFCQAGCPVYQATGIEWTVARGRVALIKDALDGSIQFDEEIREPLFNCLTCNGCVDHCPPGVPTADIVNRARQELLRRRGQSWVERLLFRNVLPKPQLLTTTARAVRVGQMAGVPSLIGRLSFFGSWSAASGVLPRLPAYPARAYLKSINRHFEHPKFRVAYFAGCAATHVFPAVAGATVRVLNHHQVEVALPDFVCCGKPPESYGDVDAGRNLARRNVAALGLLDVDAIVTSCATCSSFLKKYGQVLRSDEDYAEGAQQFSAKVKDISEFLVEIGLDHRMETVNRRKVTWHDPCHLGRYQKITTAPRMILRNVPGLEFVELPESNVCCGGAGFYAFSHHDISTKILSRKMANVQKTGATQLVTSCPACVLQLASGLRQHQMPVEAVEIVQILDEAYRHYIS